MSLQFNEESLITNNVFKYEERLHSPVNKFMGENQGPVLTTYFHIHENATTVDRGIQDIEQLFGSNSPLRFDRIENFPVYGFDQANPSNTDDAQTEDISVDGDCIILPSTIVPHPNDFFILNHLSMRGIFQVTEITYDSMKIEGYYKIHYRLHSSSAETINNLERQTVKWFRCQLDAIGTDLNPIILKEDSIKRDQVIKILNNLISDYRALFYNARHNCFLCEINGNRCFDMCGNEFIADHSLMNIDNDADVIMLHHKINDSRFPVRYQQSIYRWIEDDAPIGETRRFFLDTVESSNYIDSSFYNWSDTDIKILVPGKGTMGLSVFNDSQVEFFRDRHSSGYSDYDNLIKLYVLGKLTSVDQIPFSIGNSLRVGLTDTDNFLLTPIIVFIIRKVLQFN